MEWETILDLEVNTRLPIWNKARSAIAAFACWLFVSAAFAAEAPPVRAQALPREGTYRLQNYTDILVSTHSPALAAERADRRLGVTVIHEQGLIRFQLSSSDLVLGSWSSDRRGKILDKSYGESPDSVLFQSDSAFALKFGEAVLVYRRETGDYKTLLRRHSLAGSFVDARGRDYVFSTDGKARFPGRSFAYDVSASGRDRFYTPGVVGQPFDRYAYDVTRGGTKLEISYLYGPDPDAGEIDEYSKMSLAVRGNADFEDDTKLNAAAERGDLAAVRELLATNPRGPDYVAAINWACKLVPADPHPALVRKQADSAAAGKLAVLGHLVENVERFKVVMQKNSLRRCFFWAVAQGFPDIVSYALEHDVEIDVTDDSGKTALMVASYRGHLDIVKRLVEKGASLKALDKVGHGVLDYADASGGKEIFAFLESHGATAPTK